jgi:phosphoglycolate phosphatase-like HAD superfamily hydrolase
MPLDISRIRALCFDVDGTLSDTDDRYVQKLASWLQPIRFLLPGGATLKFARKMVMVTETPATIFFGIPDRLGFGKGVSKIGDYVYRQRLKMRKVPFTLIPGVSEMLEQLQVSYPLSIVTARGQRSTDLFLNQFNLKPHFKAIVSAHTCRHTKPYPDPVLWAANKMGFPAETCLMVGDTTVDILAGKAAGAQAAGVLCGFGTKDELLKAGADLILENTADLVKILENSNEKGIV